MNLLHEIGSHLTGLEQLKVMVTNDLRSGFGVTLDIRPIEVEEGRVVLEATCTSTIPSARWMVALPLPCWISPVGMPCYPSLRR